MATVDVLKEIAPEFANETPARLDTFITLADCQVSADIFDCDYDLALAYLAAHMLALSNRNNSGSGSNGLAGNITAKKEGDLAINYSIPTALQNMDGALSTTSYGIEFMRLRNIHVICPRTMYGC